MLITLFQSDEELGLLGQTLPVWQDGDLPQWTCWQKHSLLVTSSSSSRSSSILLPLPVRQTQTCTVLSSKKSVQTLETDLWLNMKLSNHILNLWFASVSFICLKSNIILQLFKKWANKLFDLTKQAELQCLRWNWITGCRQQKVSFHLFLFHFQSFLLVWVMKLKWWRNETLSAVFLLFFSLSWLKQISEARHEAEFFFGVGTSETSSVCWSDPVNIWHISVF